MKERKMPSFLAKGSRSFLAAVCLFAVVAAVVITFAGGEFPKIENARPVAAPLPTAAVDPLTEFRTEREQLFALQTAELNDLIHGADTDGEIRLLAQEKLLELMDRADKETLLEGVLHARGFENALVTVSENSVNVLLKAVSITRQEAAVILELVLRETGVTGGNVKIIPVQ